MLGGPVRIIAATRGDRDLTGRAHGHPRSGSCVPVGAVTRAAGAGAALAPVRRLARTGGN
ncbi:hypothetical protein GCM10022222_13220 [Amycolatopsis ultiminotia]|uniref:Uncharacterized protein n=1 Tax=Amycolatopsis ultiminotia TaxID=543629 RepID=A0ABP6VD02_9PSEU